MVHQPSQDKAAACPTSAVGIVQNGTKSNWTTAANLIMQHDELAGKIKESTLSIIERECTRLEHDRDFTLWKSSPDELKAFSFRKMESELKQKAPFLFSLLSQVTKDSPLLICTAVSVALRGRNPRMSSLAYYINSVLQFGGAKKAVFQRLSKLGISTTYNNAIAKQGSMASTCGEELQLLKVQKESHLNRLYETEQSAIHPQPEAEAEAETIESALHTAGIFQYDVGGAGWPG